MEPMTQENARNWRRAIAAAALLLTVACSRPPSGTEAAAPKAPSPDVLATVDGREIRSGDIDKAYKSTVQASAKPSDEEAATLRLNILDQLITQDLLLARAKALGQEATDTEVENTFAERKRSVSDDQFQKNLAAQGLTVDDLKAGIRKELSVQKVLDHEVTSKVNVTDQDVSDFFSKNRAQFNITETQYRLAQIVITAAKDPNLHNRQNDDAGSPAEAKQKLDMLMNRLRAGGDFAQLAADYSEDPQSLVNGGDLGFVSMSAINQVSPQLGAVVQKMQAGSVTTVTMGPNYSIFLVISKEAPGQRELSSPDVRDNIRDTIKTHRTELLRTAYLAAMRDDATVVNYFAKQIVEAQQKQAPTLVPAAPAKK